MHSSSRAHDSDAARSKIRGGCGTASEVPTICPLRASLKETLPRLDATAREQLPGETWCGHITTH